MNDNSLYKIFKYKDDLENNLTIEEISKVYREIIYKQYEKFTDKEFQKIRVYQLLRNTIDIFTQMINGRVFDENYLIDKLRY